VSPETGARCICCGEQFTPRRSRFLCDADQQAVAKIRHMKPSEQRDHRDALDLAEARWRVATNDAYVLYLEHGPLVRHRV